MVVEVGESVGERKVSARTLRISSSDLAAGQCSGVTSVIESDPEIARGIEKDAGQHIRQWLREFDFDEVLPRLRTFINENGPWLAVDKVVNAPIEITDVMPARTSVRRAL